VNVRYTHCSNSGFDIRASGRWIISIYKLPCSNIGNEYAMSASLKKYPVPFFRLPQRLIRLFALGDVAYDPQCMPTILTVNSSKRQFDGEFLSILSACL